jgi:hypothetical protein
VTPTNEDTLSDLFRDAIVGVSPRIAFKGGERWKPYERPVEGASRTRRFRLIWESGGIQPRGAMAGQAIEHQAVLRVRTDYVGTADGNQHAMIDDFHQLRDTLSNLKATNNGVVMVTGLRVQEVRGGTDSDDVVVVDHTYQVRYMRNAQL